jgi:hypothetical protein
MSTDKFYVSENTIFTFDNLDDWKAEAEKRGLNVKQHPDGDFFAEEDDVTMIGYYNDDWGMLS